MNLKCRMILDEYREENENFQQLQEIVRSLLKKICKENKIDVYAIQARVKTEESLTGKLELKGDKYNSLFDITDILGSRVVTTFADGVDSISALIPKYFDIDVENSIDKRTLLKDNVFGYMSVHYICSLKKDSGYPEKLCGRRFEIQLCSVLQHIWSLINHDLGYKTDFGIPHSVARDFARLASLVEIADEHFIRIRDSVNEYTEQIRKNISEGNVSAVSLDSVTLKEYMRLGKPMLDFLNRLASISGAEISFVNPDSYIRPLDWLGMKTIGDVQDMITNHGDQAIALAKVTLECTDLDILASNVALNFLCQCELLSRKMDRERMAEFFNLVTGDKKRAERMTSSLLRKSGVLEK